MGVKVGGGETETGKETDRKVGGQEGEGGHTVH